MTSLVFIVQVLDPKLHPLANMARVAAYTKREHVVYGLVLEALLAHRSPENNYIIFPQLYIDWKPQTTDKRHVIPDFGIGRYIFNDLCFLLQGGAEVKPMIGGLSQNSVSEGVPFFWYLKQMHRDNFERAFTTAVSGAYLQAEDQIKSALKCGHLPYKHDMVYQWLIFVGPYFRSYDFGPFNEAQIKTRGHRPNPSGDSAELNYLLNRSVSLGDWFVVGSEDGHNHLQEYIRGTARFLNRPEDAVSDYPQP